MNDTKYSSYQSIPFQWSPIQAFIVKAVGATPVELPVSFSLPPGILVSGCMVIALDWEGTTPVTSTSDLSVSYSSATLPLLSLVREQRRQWPNGDYLLNVTQGSYAF